MAEPISIQQLKDASEDAISLAEFINKPANVMIPRRLAADINSLQYYLDYMSSYAQHSYETYDEMVANAVNLPNGVSAFVTNDLDATKNGIYTYNGTSFVKGEYQPEKAAKDYVEAKLGGLQVFDGKVRAQDVSTVDGSTQDVKNAEFLQKLDDLPFEDGVLADTFVTMTKNAVGSVSRNLRDVNSDSITAFDFGAIGDGTHHPISERYDNLTEAKAQYPHVTSLTDSIDWAAIQALLNYCHVNKVKNVDLTINASINKTLTYLGNNHATNRMQGYLQLTSTSDMQELIWLQGVMFKFDGVIEMQGYLGTGKVGMLNRQNKYGLRTGGDGGLNNSEHLHVGTVKGSDFAQLSVFCDQNSMFVSFGSVIGRGCGSGWYDIASGSPETFTHTTNYSGLTNPVVSADYSQYSQMTVDSLPPIIDTTATNLLCRIGNELYDVLSVDRANSTINVYPVIDTSNPTSGKAYYYYGGALHTTGNNSGCIKVGMLQAILCGFGFSGASLYGSTITNTITEFCGVGLIFGRRGETTIGYDFGNIYYEANNFDIVSMWDSEYNHARINSTQGLDFSKVVSLAAYRIVPTNKLREYNTLLPKGLAVNYMGDIFSPEKAPSNEVSFTGTEIVSLTTPARDIAYFQSELNLALLVDSKLNALFGYDNINITVFGANEQGADYVSLTAPDGWTVNGLKHFSYSNFAGAATFKLFARFHTKDIICSVDTAHRAYNPPTQGYFRRGCLVENATAENFVMWRNTVSGFASNTPFSASSPISKNTYIYVDNRVYRAVKDGNTSPTAPTHTSGIVSNGTTEFEYVGAKCAFELIKTPV